MRYIITKVPSVLAPYQTINERSVLAVRLLSGSDGSGLSGPPTFLPALKGEAFISPSNTRVYRGSEVTAQRLIESSLAEIARWVGKGGFTYTTEINTTKRIFETNPHIIVRVVISGLFTVVSIDMEERYV